MTTRMLIDANHPEETRVVIIKGNRLEEFDYESATKRQLRGNIYLAKVTRVEPSLQAAFVDYGGNRHGFLTFNEIHPDYYQIPIADRKELLAEEAQRQAANLAAEDAAAEAAASHSETESKVNSETQADGGESSNGPADQESNGDDVEAMGDDDIDEARLQRVRTGRRYKIQEVIKRRQVILVQVVKEERGTKGAALTTYLSFAGRYGVLMPNTARGGGVSRKIVNSQDRQRLKMIINQLELPEGMGLIIRTAGADRSKAEIKRDYEYLFRTWDGVRKLTLQSTAPYLVHEEANLIKRSIRDLYAKEIEQILVEGDEGYKTAKSFMRSLLPSHAKRVQPHREGIKLFHQHQVEQQLDLMHSAEVNLKGGGYLVINPTEALVAIDVNSGRATKERNIEETATKTNLEAADEIARQLRLRDLSGLIVIDFIDMDERRNNRNVERRLKESLKKDRGRIQVGRISPFGLLEMSRQRLRPSFLEASTRACEHCHGEGVVRSTESSALHVLRSIEDEALRAKANKIAVYVPSEIAIYLLNQKRGMVTEIEQRYDVGIVISADESLKPSDLRLESTGSPAPKTKTQKHVKENIGESTKNDSRQSEIEEKQSKGDGAREEADTAPVKRRRRGKRGGRRRAKQIRTNEANEEVKSEEGSATEGSATTPQATDREINTETSVETKPKRVRRSPVRKSRRPQENPSNATREVGLPINIENKDVTSPRALSSTYSNAEKPKESKKKSPDTDDVGLSLANPSPPVSASSITGEDAKNLPPRPEPAVLPISSEKPTATKKRARRKGWWQRKEE